MKRQELVMDVPHLDALCNAHPPRKATILRLLWPKIQICLDHGHTVRQIHDTLKLDGLEINYKNLCACISELRRRDAPDRVTALRTPGEIAAPVAVKRPTSDGHVPVDPLANVRRLTEERRPGFQYPGTLPEKDLFGE